MKFQLLDTEKFKQTIPYPPRNYWDFPVVGLTFCESLSYSRPVWFHDCLFRGRRKALSLALRNLEARIENCGVVPWDKARDEKATQDYLADWAGEKGGGIIYPGTQHSNLSTMGAAYIAPDWNNSRTSCAQIINSMSQPQRNNP